ncbi:MAG: FtsX-like permease family protein [Ginsengibacter sp.]
MLKNYFNIAFRNFLHRKVFSFINIIGLGIGISASLVIFLIVDYDLTFDKFHKDGDRIFRVVSDFNFSGNDVHSSGVSSPMGTTVYKELAGIEFAAAFRTANETKVSIPVENKDRPVVFKKEKHIVYADQNYFRLIQYTWITGSPSTSLKVPYQVVLTASKAAFYFPAIPALQVIGREIIFDDSVRATVSGIVKDIEQNTDFTFTTFISRATLESTSLKPDDWDQWDNTNSASQLMIKLSKGTSRAQIVSRVNTIYKKYRKDDPEDHSKTAYSLQPLATIHFDERYDNFDQRLAHKPTMYGLLAVAAFLLILGCINFINLTTAQASQRAKEIGIRKTMGSSKRQLVFQFLGETFFLTLVSTLLSLALTPLLLKAFADFIPEGLHFHLSQPGLLIFLSVLTIIVTLLAGFYPALVLSSYKPVAVLKNQLGKSTKTRSAWFRKSLTVSQFVIAQVFIIATILVSKQIRFSLNMDLGFKKDAVVYFSTNYYDTSKNSRLVLLQKLKAIPGIQMVSMAYNPPSSNSQWTSTTTFNDGKKDIETDVQVLLADTNYVKLFGLKLLAGNDLPFSDTPNSVLINEAYANILGFHNPQHAIGKQLRWNQKEIPIVGVLRNFHQRSLHEMIKPLLIANSGNTLRTFNMLLQSQDPAGTVWKGAIDKINNAYNEVYPEADIELNFLDKTLAKYYEGEQHISGLLLWATVLAIFISCLGLLGLVMYITNQKTKEIGIRKVIGATISQIILLLSKDFLKLIFIAFLVALPVAWWGAHTWLQNFAYKTPMSWWVYIAGGLVMLLMALIILIARTFRAASANPVESLRTE